MVQLKEKSQIDEKTFPYIFWWDELRRKKHNFYEQRISQSLDGIQKLQMSAFFIRAFFPSFAQNGLYELEIDRQLQKLGDYTPEEVELYQQNHPTIKHNLSQTFGSTFPKAGFLLGGAMGGFLAIRRINLLQVIGVVAIPMFLERMYHKWDTRNRFEVLQFLDWDIEQRTSKANLERFAPIFEKSQMDLFKKNYGDKTVLEVYDGYLKSLEKKN